MAVPNKIDVHHHIIPPFYHELWDSLKIPVGTAIPTWSIDSSTKLMDKLHIDIAFLSLSAPGANIAGSPDAARQLVRKYNDYAHAIRATDPARFGFFASLPSLIDQEGTLTEIQYAFEHLHADGVTLFTSYGGKYLGAKDFLPVWESLNRFNAVVHIHPIHSREQSFTTHFLPQPLIDYPHETVRAASDLVLSGRKRQFPNCKIILSHAGGTFPSLVERLTILATSLFSSLLEEGSPRGDEIMEDAKSFYFDLALGGSSNVLDTLLNFAPEDHILYGSDFPYANEEAKYFDKCLDAYAMKDEVRRKCYRENALKLFPRHIVFGLLSGWWSFNDGRSYALQSAEDWMETFRQAGFEYMSYSNGYSEEARTQRLLIASTRPPKIQGSDLEMGIKSGPKFRIETMVYKVIDDVSIEADVYLPIKPVEDQTMAVDNGVIPISIDHRLCPEVNIVDGPMTDVRDGLLWAQTEFPKIAIGYGINVDPGNVALTGWSTGGHLAMTTAWTACNAGNEPPRAILSFYGPSDFKALASNTALGTDYPARTMSMKDIRRSLPTKPITSYDHSGHGDSTNLGWVKPGDARSELVLSLFKERTSLNFLLHGISEDHAHRTPTAAEIEEVSPIAQLRQGKYKTPTFSVHGDRDEIVPCDMSVKFDEELSERGVQSGLCVVEGARHIHDLGMSFC